MSKISRIAAHPLQALSNYVLRQRPEWFFRQNAQRLESLGISKPTAVLSFDCDTVEDARVAGEVHSRLSSLGIKLTYAVPGRLLHENNESYSEILKSGGEFINHGGNRHTDFDPLTQRHFSTNFYDQIGKEMVLSDFLLGHNLVSEFCGVPPLGFRSPHFGTFSSKRNLTFIHSLAREIGYTYSSSSTPYWSFRWGPLSRRDGLTEIPVSGRSTSPLTILDSWSAFASPRPSLSPSRYFDELDGWVNAANSFGPVLLNIYADPSHIYDQPLFFSAVEHVSNTFSFSTLGDLARVLRDE